MANNLGKICVAYHGTEADAAASILKEGFRTGTYFSLRLDSAIAFGGHHVFAVEFPEDPWFDEMVPVYIDDQKQMIRRWQFTHDAVPREAIRSYTIYSLEVKYSRD